VNGEARVSYRRLIWLGVAVLAVSAIVELAVEWTRASAALQQWVCDKGTVPLPAGPGGCSAGFLLHWMLSRLPLYVGIVTIVMLASEAAVIVWSAIRSRPEASSVVSQAVRLIALAIGVFAFAELVACAGDTTCAQSLTCT
jgi:hypothetical protein